MTAVAQIIFRRLLNHNNRVYAFYFIFVCTFYQSIRVCILHSNRLLLVLISFKTITASILNQKSSTMLMVIIIISWFCFDIFFAASQFGFCSTGIPFSITWFKKCIMNVMKIFFLKLNVCTGSPCAFTNWFLLYWIYLVLLFFFLSMNRMHIILMTKLCCYQSRSPNAIKWNITMSAISLWADAVDG